MATSKIVIEISGPMHGITERSMGERVEYHPWEFDWHDMDEPTRVSNGIYVFCYGHGEFEIIRVPDDGRLVDEQP